MPRHAKCRHVCRLPAQSCFTPEPSQTAHCIILSIEEYETVRLIDYVGLTQEECAVQMNVARTTVQRIYNDARHKLSVFLVEGHKLQIQGGSYKLCPKHNCEGCQKLCCQKKVEDERKQ